MGKLILRLVVLATLLGLLDVAVSKTWQAIRTPAISCVCTNCT